MEQMPHHREEIQKQLDKAQDEAHRDNKTFDEAQVRAEGETHISDEEMQSHFSEREKAMVAEDEKEVSPELAEVVSRLREKGYLDTSFEGKEFHRLEVRPLSKEEALDEYRKSGGKTLVWDELEKNMRYYSPEAETLEVMIMNFNKDIIRNEAVAEMYELGVRPLTCGELIQYGIAHPSHQEQKVLIGLGSVLDLANPHAPILCVRDSVRTLFATPFSYLSRSFIWGDKYRFPVVRK